MSQTSLKGSGDPLDAVRAWWRAWERRDPAALDALALYDYFEFTGSADRHTVGKDAFLRLAQVRFGRATLAAWSIRDEVVRLLGDVAVCSYHWEESGTLDGKPFAARGVATDVLRWRDGSWMYLAHHATRATR